MEYIFETEHLKIRKFELDDARCLYENHLEEEVKKWIPNESYLDIQETKEAISFYTDCVNYRFAGNFLLILQKNCRLSSLHPKKKEQIKRRDFCTLPAPFLEV